MSVLNQKTIKRKIHIEGIGLHCGKKKFLLISIQQTQIQELFLKELTLKIII